MAPGPGSNPPEEMGRIDYLAAEMRTPGLTHDDHMLYTVSIDALPAEYDVEARNLASRDSIGRDDIIKAVRERHHRRSGNRKKRSNAGHGTLTGGGGGDGGDGRGKGEDGGKGKGERRGRKGRGSRGTNEVGDDSAAVAGGDGSNAKAIDTWGSATGIERRAIGRPTARRSYAADATAGGMLLMCAPRSDAADETDRGTLLMSAPCKEEIVLAASSEVGAMGDHGDDGTCLLYTSDAADE